MRLELKKNKFQSHKILKYLVIVSQNTFIFILAHTILSCDNFLSNEFSILKVLSHTELDKYTNVSLNDFIPANFQDFQLQFDELGILKKVKFL